MQAVRGRSNSRGSSINSSRSVANSSCLINSPPRQRKSSSSENNNSILIVQSKEKQHLDKISNCLKTQKARIKKPHDPESCTYCKNNRLNTCSESIKTTSTKLNNFKRKQQQEECSPTTNTTNKNDFRIIDKNIKNAEKLVFIPALVSSRVETSSSNNELYSQAKVLTMNDLMNINKNKTFTMPSTSMDTQSLLNRSQKSFDTSNDFQRGRYLRSSYDKSLLMYNNNNNNSLQSLSTKLNDNIKIEQLLQKFRTKLHSSKPNVKVDQLNDDII